jgi:hypothetical protein
MRVSLACVYALFCKYVFILSVNICVNNNSSPFIYSLEFELRSRINQSGFENVLRTMCFEGYFEALPNAVFHKYSFL